MRQAGLAQGGTDRLWVNAVETVYVKALILATSLLPWLDFAKGEENGRSLSLVCFFVSTIL
jgi:hypothetical protein